MKVLGISGGVDSMLMLEMMKNQEIVVAHVNHGFREESNEEYQMVKEKCKEEKIPFEGIKLNLKTETEIEAREARYKFYEDVMEKYDSNELYLGHHSDDLVETLLMNIGRGGIGTALIGMSKRNKSMSSKDYWINRPLLEKTKKEIYEEAKKRNVQWMEDSSNQNSEKYLRNKVRLEIMPKLKEIFPKINENVKRITEYNKEIEEYLEEKEERKIKELEIQKNEIYKIKKGELNESIEKKRLLKKIAKKITKEKTKNEIWKMIDEKINAKELNTDVQKIKKGLYLINDREYYYLFGEKTKEELKNEREKTREIKKRELKNKKIPKSLRKSIMVVEENKKEKIIDFFGNQY